MAGSVLLLLGACARFGPARLDADQLGYSRALSASDKRQTLLNVVRLRYADLPVFLDTTQVIAGYQLQQSMSGSLEIFPNAAPSTYLGGGAAMQLQESPTFTLQPVGGDRFAQGFLRPLSPIDLLPLVQGGLPIDVVFRLAVQNVGALQNSVALEQGRGTGSEDFFALTHVLRELQIAGVLGVRISRSTIPAPDGKAVNGPEHAFLTFDTSSRPDLAARTMAARRLLGLSPTASFGEVVYGRDVSRGAHISILTRPMLGVLAQLAFQADVPVEDVARHRTVASIGIAGSESRPVVVIRSGASAPRDPFVAVEYDGAWFWIDKGDFDSKLAFSVVGVLLALAKTGNTPGTIITIPTR